MKKYSHNSN